ACRSAAQRAWRGNRARGQRRRRDRCRSRRGGRRRPRGYRRVGQAADVIARRYQLRKEAAAIVARGPPWIFRDQMSSAAHVFRDGQWLRLVDGDNRVVGHGIYAAEGAIAIRVLRTGAEPPDAAWLRQAVARAIGKRGELAHTTDGLRLLNGES